MRENRDGTSAFLVGTTAAVLTVAVLLSGCASKGARHESSLYDHKLAPSSGGTRHAGITPPAPQPAVRGYAQRQPSGQRQARQKQARTYMSDEQRYSAIYGVPPRPDYLATATPPASYNAEPLPGIERQQRVASLRTGRRLGGPEKSARRAVHGRGSGRGSERRIVVTRGDTLHNIAWRYKTTVTALLRANNIAHGNIQTGQELIIPSRR